MKRLFVVLLVVLTPLTFTGFSKQKIKVDVQNADNISIFYCVSSYAAFISDMNIVTGLSENLSNLTFEPIDKKIDFHTMLSINFFKGEKCIGKFSVDNNNVFLINGDTKCLKIVNGKFDYNYVKNIYDKSKKVQNKQSYKVTTPSTINRTYTGFVFSKKGVELGKIKIKLQGKQYPEGSYRDYFLGIIDIDGNKTQIMSTRDKGPVAGYEPNVYYAAIDYPSEIEAEKGAAVMIKAWVLISKDFKTLYGFTDKLRIKFGTDANFKTRLNIN